MVQDDLEKAGHTYSDSLLVLRILVLHISVRDYSHILHIIKILCTKIL